MSNPLDDAFELLGLATQLENEKKDNVEAATKYYEACYLMRTVLQRMPTTPENQQTRQLIQEKIAHYENLASDLLKSSGDTPIPMATALPISPRSCQWQDEMIVVPAAPVPVAPLSSSRFSDATSKSLTTATITERAGQANARLAHALDLDENGQAKDAISKYMEAAELYLSAIKLAEEAKNGVEESITIMLKRRLEGALDRVEQLKHPGRNLVHEPKVGEVAKKQEGSSLTAEEISVLRRSSLIASGLFLPWSDEDSRVLAMEANTVSSSHFTDPDGFLKLSTKQKARIHKWARPLEIMKIRGRKSQRPVMVKAITPYTIRQRYVTDCSFIASLCITAAFERRFKKGLVTSIIHPQTSDGRPMYNPFGKYMVKLWLNGVARQVMVDDYLPVDRHGNLLCSHTTSSGLELWVSIIEKAYMKLCGGYDFPGSNSGVDLFSLTGWIPERIFFPEDPSKVRDFETPPERAFDRLLSANSFGDCLITVSTTSDMEDEKAKEIGLVTGHAYAVLSVIQTRNGTRLLQLKNPWAHQSWKGKYSCHDRVSWSDPAFCAEVGYNAKLAAKEDDGVFWISWDDILVYFRNLHLSWNTALFAFRVTTHGFWPSEQGPRDDTFNVSENPQFILSLSERAVAKKATIWILLSRHVSRQEQEGCEANDYLTVHIHRNHGSKERIFYPGGKTCVLTGAYTNNAHVLARYEVSGPEDKHLSLVLSQYKKANDLGYTISCFCTEKFSLTRPLKELPYTVEFTSAWTEKSSGGPVGQESYERNPMWGVQVPDGCYVQVRCSATRFFAINVMLVGVDTYGKRLKWITSEPAIDTGNYRHGFVATATKKLQKGAYTMIVSTFNVGQIGAFKVKVNSSTKLKFEQLV